MATEKGNFAQGQQSSFQLSVAGCGQTAKNGVSAYFDDQIPNLVIIINSNHLCICMHEFSLLRKNDIANNMHAMAIWLRSQLLSLRGNSSIFGAAP